MSEAATAAPAAEKSDTGLITAGWILAFLMPLVGFFIGLALMIRGRAGNGVGVMVTSVLVVVIVTSIILSAAATEAESFGQCLEHARTYSEINAC